MCDGNHLSTMMLQQQTRLSPGFGSCSDDKGSTLDATASAGEGEDFPIPPNVMAAAAAAELGFAASANKVLPCVSWLAGPQRCSQDQQIICNIAWALL